MTAQGAPAPAVPPAWADERGRVLAVACDHVAGFVERLGVAGLAAFKADVVEALSPLATAVLVDEPTLGAVAGRAADGCALLGGFERDPARPDPSVRIAAIAAAGAAGVKYYVPFDPARPGAHDAEAEAVGAACTTAGLPLLLEPLLVEPRSPDRTAGAVAAAARFAAPRFGAAVLKLDVPAVPATPAAIAAQAEASRLPWCWLGGGLDDAALVQALEAAAATVADVPAVAGLRGVVVGRALWEGALAQPTPAGRRAWLADEGAARLLRLRRAVGRL